MAGLSPSAGRQNTCRRFLRLGSRVSGGQKPSPMFCLATITQAAVWRSPFLAVLDSCPLTIAITHRRHTGSTAGGLIPTATWTCLVHLYIRSGTGGVTQIFTTAIFASSLQRSTLTDG